MTEGQKRGWPIPSAIAAWIAVAITILVGVTWATSAGLLTWSMAVDARMTAQDFVSRYAIIAYVAYVVLFVVMALALFPAQLWIIVFGAMVFGFWPALIVSWAAALLSAVAVFLAARGALAGKYREKAAGYLARVEQEFQRDQFSWMLAMRFVPVVPYFVSNVAPAFLGARLPPFAIAAAIGVIPYVAAYTFAGDKAASVLNRDTPPDVASLAADMFPVMLSVAALPLLALAVKRFRRKPAATR
ncbi:MAG TPA: VTT domain-containing protein [Hyphomonadaceae bacterium]|nr:VTT domain-containing protein [Hyphomonadaceae bacterium]